MTAVSVLLRIRMRGYGGGIKLGGKNLWIFARMITEFQSMVVGKIRPFLNKLKGLM